jgi:hypothetical protein
MNESENSDTLTNNNDIFKVYIIPLILFVATLVTTTIAGAFWVVSPAGGLELAQIAEGLPYSISILTILGFHEFWALFLLRNIMMLKPLFHISFHSRQLPGC